MPYKRGPGGCLKATACEQLEYNSVGISFLRILLSNAFKYRANSDNVVSTLGVKVLTLRAGRGKTHQGDSSKVHTIAATSLTGNRRDFRTILVQLSKDTKFYQSCAISVL